jgi:hypothetical protein
MALFSTVNLSQIEADMASSQEAVEKLLDNEEQALARLEEIGAIADPQERLNEAAKLLAESDALIVLAKEMSGVIGRVKKRMNGCVGQMKVAIEDEIETLGDDKGKYETQDYAFSTKNNPVKVVVDDKEGVPQKYRTVPKPIPPWEEWDVNKNEVKQALVKEKVQSINGVHLEQNTRVEVKPR